MTYLELLIKQDPIVAVVCALVVGAFIGAGLEYLVTRQHRDSRGRFTKG